jgi:hypothetical protein
MKTTLIILLLFVANVSFGQKDKDFQLGLSNAIIIGQMDNSADRYSVEINMTDLFVKNGIKSMASLNMMKLGSNSQQLASDSVSKQVKAKGFDTFVLISVRGYDKRFKANTSNEDFHTALGRANLFQLYQEDIVSVSFEFKFYRGGQLVQNETIKCGNAGSREKVLKKLRKKIGKKLTKKWMK